MSDRFAASRQAQLSQRAKAAGKKRIAIWIPGDVHAQVTSEARARGITMQERIIDKLRHKCDR